LALGQSQSMSVLNEQESQRLESEANVLTAALDHESSKLRLAAEDDLIKKGLASLAPLEYRKVEFSVRETQDRMNMERKRLANLTATLAAQRKAEAARIQSLEAAVVRAQRRVDALTVRAPSTGIIQQITAELGQQLADGNEVARIVNHEALYAELSVQELQVSSVAKGQTVLLDTRHSKLTGTVTRIDPAIRNGTVFVDVEISEPLPPEARPDLSIEGTIRTADVKDALFVVRPAGVQRNSTVGIYRLTADLQRARRQPVQLGQSSVDHVQILHGLTVGETIIVSDTSAFKDHESILIN
jgi:HlyD family secretion protein